MAAVQRAFPKTLVQFEDFATTNALRLLQRYRDRTLAFNDDIQGTAAVALAGLLNAARLTGRSVEDQTLLFFGAGAAATGIADLVVLAMTRRGLSEVQARQRCWLMDSRGLVVDSRADIEDYKRPYAQPHAPVIELSTAVTALRPTTLIGVSGQAQTFTQPVIRAMAQHNERPIIFALSNPTSKSECIAEQAYTWSGGRAVFASGSPFAPVEQGGMRFIPRQANNAYVFPGIGLGVIASCARRVSDTMFLAAADELAAQTDEVSLQSGALFPPLARIREVSAAIALAVAQTAIDEGTAPTPSVTDLSTHIRSMMYEPIYRDYKA
jgi:malate dehydrogenase (oxaloacetate-decarboxylating)(NADP+)